MSDTDDTDDLLLIPPDFFIINSDTEDSLKVYGPYYTVVDDLITQVSSLENRITSIESISDTTLMNSSTNSSNLMTGARKYSSLEELPKSHEVYPGSSTQSTPQKPRTKLLLNSLPSTPNADIVKKNGTHLQSRYRHIKTPTSARIGTDLVEINKFISHVKNIQKHDAARNLNALFESSVLNKESSVEENRRQVVGKPSWEGDCSVRTSSTFVEPTPNAEMCYKLGDTRCSVPDRGMGMRDLIYDEHEHIPRPRVPSVSDIPTSVPNSESVLSDSTSFSSSDSTQLTVHPNLQGKFDEVHLNNAFDVLDKHKNILSRADFDVSTLLDKEPRQKKSEGSVSRKKLALINLSELWNQNLSGAGDYGRDHLKFFGKLQEEKLRRQHCEDLIRQLQSRLLELQQRVAVAIQVGNAKDDAIWQIHKSWEEAAAKIDSLHHDKMRLELQIAEVTSKTSNELQEACKKVNHYESESSKALNLAHNNQEKVASLEKQNASLALELQSYEERYKKLENDVVHERDNNQQLSRILTQKEIELGENKDVQTQASKEIAQSKRAVEMCQAELTSIKSKQTTLETRYNETLVQIKDLENDKKRLMADLDNYKKIEKNHKDETSRIKETNEQSKAELRMFYQNQVEILVREKLKEFQQQLEKAEGSLQEEVRNREMAIAKNAAAHIQQLNDKNAMEIHLLEEKHKEEMKLFKLQLFQSQQEINNLQMKFKQQQERRSNVVQQLQRVMEAQWHEALKIINNGKSPIVAQDKSTNTIDQLNHLKSRSYNNLEEILFREDASSGKNVQMYKRNSAPTSKLLDSLSMNSLMDESYNKIVETPLTSRSDKNKLQGENEFQKYVEMLLNKQPGHSTDEQLLTYQENYENQTQTDSTKLSRVGNKDRFGKPPWK